MNSYSSPELLNMSAQEFQYSMPGAVNCSLLDLWKTLSQNFSHKQILSSKDVNTNDSYSETVLQKSNSSFDPFSGRNPLKSPASLIEDSESSSCENVQMQEMGIYVNSNAKLDKEMVKDVSMSSSDSELTKNCIRKRSSSQEQVSGLNPKIKTKIPDKEFSLNNDQLETKVRVHRTWNPKNVEGLSNVDDTQTNQGMLSSNIGVTRKCQICQKYVRRENFSGHVKKHKGELDFVCEHCGSRYSSKKVLKSHQISKHSKVENLLDCNYCEMKFPTAYRLKEHMIKHSDSCEFVCKECNKFFRRKRALTEHMEYKHGEKRCFTCNTCKKTFKWKSNYMDHIKSHSVTYPCLVCGTSFNRVSSLTRHQGTHGIGEKPHTCHICGRGFIQKTPFWSHMEKHHDLTKDKLVEMFPEKHGSKLLTQRQLIGN